MTLVLTELSTAGIAMAADSAITQVIRRGNRCKIREVDEKGWLKLIRVPSIRAAIAYWGAIGVVTKKQFDAWLKERVIDTGDYTDLPSFADHLTRTLNEATRQKPLQEGYDIGVHVAGYHPWTDGEKRPFFFHVHNGHGLYDPGREWDDNDHLVALHPRWVSDTRKLFEKHQDFPSVDKSIEENLAILEEGYTTRNGEFFFYTIIWSHLSEALRLINLIPDVSIPKNPKDLNSRKGLLHTTLEMMIRLYRCSNQSHIIGGNVTSLGINHNGFLSETKTMHARRSKL